MNEIGLYDSATIDSLPWPESENGRYAKAFLEPFLKNDPGYYIDNVDTTMMVLTIDDLILPITINQAECKNSYVCSPYTHYISYALEELHLISNPVFRIPLKGMIRALGLFLKKGQINRNVIVNNWLFSTNLYANLEQGQIDRITKFLKTRYPSHAIIFRSINTCLGNKLYDAFQENRYALLLSRQVYFLDTFDEQVYKSKPFKQDLKLLKESEYRVVDASEITEEEIPRIVELYNQLYLNKYSLLNPQFNANFIKLALKNGILTIKALKNANHRIDGVLGYFQRNGVMTTPLFGYNTNTPQKAGLYRLISTVLALEAKKNGYYLNQSSGAAEFKALRKATPHLEYTGVYYNHLSWWRKGPWKLLKLVVNGLLIPLIKYYKL